LLAGLLVLRVVLLVLCGAAGLVQLVWCGAAGVVCVIHSFIRVESSWVAVDSTSVHVCTIN